MSCRASNIVTAIAHDVLRLRGLSTSTCTVDQLISAYGKAEKVAESVVRIAERIAKRQEREAA